MAKSLTAAAFFVVLLCGFISVSSPQSGIDQAKRLAGFHIYLFPSDSVRQEELDFYCRNIADSEARRLSKDAQATIRKELCTYISQLVAERKQSGLIRTPMDRLSTGFMNTLAHDDIERLLKFRTSAAAQSIQPALTRMAQQWVDNRNAGYRGPQSVSPEVLSRRYEVLELRHGMRLLVDMAVAAGTSPENIRAGIRGLAEAEAERIWRSDSDELDRMLAGIPKHHIEEYRGFLDSAFGKRERAIVADAKKADEEAIARVFGLMSEHAVKRRTEWRSMFPEQK